MTPVLKQTRTPLRWDTGLWAAGCIGLEVEGGTGVRMGEVEREGKRARWG